MANPQVDRHAQIESIFLQAVELPETGRSEFLAVACANDIELRSKIELLLANDPGDEVGTPRHPERIGRFAINRLLGEGGMGTVYLAEQTNPTRTVALKVIRRGFDSAKDVLRRFEVERQALALLNHPNVAHFYEAGSTDDGQPYFALEYVLGTPITEYCDAARFTLEERLHLFIDVCHGVQHAHQKGIIHRDIKPSNVLVAVQDGTPTPKLIDFGVAKATQQSLSERATVTKYGQLVGTPGYLSPEQAELAAQDVDTRADIYSLGVMLYELLVGVLPFDTKKLLVGGLEEVQRMIREVDPSKPSTKLSSIGLDSTAIARMRKTEVRSLVRQVRGDLDWIVMKCLEKDRTRRYDTANGLAHEIQRFLEHEPVLAGPPSAAYRMRRFVRRNRAAVISGAVVLTLLLALSVGMTGLYLTAERARRSEEAQRKIAEANEAKATQQSARADKEADASRMERDKVAKFAQFMEETLEGVGPSVAMGRDTKMLKELMDEAAKRIEAGELTNSPEAELRLRLTIGGVYREIAEFNAAERMLTETLRLATGVQGTTTDDYARSLEAIGAYFESQGRWDLALAKHEEALSIRQKLVTGESPEVAASLNNVALCLDELGRSSEAFPKLESALAMRRRLFPHDHKDVATSLNNLGYCLESLGRAEDAAPHYSESLDMRRRLFSGDHPEVAASLNNLGACLASLDKDETALQLYKDALEMRRRLFSGDHPDTAMSLNNMAVCLKSLGRGAEALTLHREALNMRKNLFHGNHPDIANSLNNVGSCLQSIGQCEEALPYFEESLSMLQVLSPEKDMYIGSCLHNKAFCLKEVGRFGEALPAFQNALKLYRAAYATDHPQVANCLKNLADCLDALGRTTEALDYWREALEMYKRLFPQDSLQTANALSRIALCLASLGQSVEALSKAEEALSMLRRLFPGDHAHVARGLIDFAECLSGLNRSEEALAASEEALEMYSRLLKGTDWRIRSAEITKGRILLQLKQYPAATRLLVPLWETIADRADVPKKRKSQCLEALIRLFGELDSIEPDQGHAAKVGEYREKLAEYCSLPAIVP